MSAPVGTACNGRRDPIDVGARPPVLSWRPAGAQRAAQVVVETAAGDPLWDSGRVPTQVFELRYAGPPLASRTAVRWRVRVWDDEAVDALPSPWSADAAWETALLSPADWTARWIARRVPARTRPHRAVDAVGVAWAGPGDVLEQPVPTPPATSLVVADLCERTGDDWAGLLELVGPAGDVLAARDVVREPVPLDHFARFLVVAGDPPEEGCALRLTVTAGEIGWRTGPQPEAAADDAADDGVSAVPVTRRHRRNGIEQPGVLLVGVEVPAAEDPVFTASFDLEAVPASARLHATGLGYGRFEVNGLPVTDATLEPAQTDYDRRVLYAVHDVTALLRPGVNTVRAELGRGFYSVRGGDTWGWQLAPWHGEPRLIAQLEVEDAAGRRTALVSDGSWRTRPGSTVADVLYTGVVHRPGVDHPWEDAAVVAGPAGALTPTDAPPVRRRAPVPPVHVAQVGPGDAVVDFGDVLVGRIRCRIAADGPGEVVLQHGELLGDDGAVLCENPLVAGAAQTDRVRLDGPTAAFEWEPDFTYKGFRYVRITTTGGARADDVRAVPVLADVPAVGAFRCEDETLTWIDGALAATFANNLHGVPTDTPVYEKNGWTADAHLGTTAALHHHGLRWTLAKWLDDHADAQAPDGGIPQIIPTPGWGLAVDPAWSASSVLIPWDLHWEDGDREALAQRLPMMTAYADHALERAERDGWLWRAHGWGDWLAPGYQFPPEGAAPTSTMMLLRTAQVVADAHDALGGTAAAVRYRAAAARLQEAFHAEWFDAASGRYLAPGTGYRQSMNVLPLAFGAVPDGEESRVFAGLEADLLLRTSGHLDCGATAVKHLLPVLADHGRADLAIGVAVQRTRPGWGAWREQGGTLWESWDADARSRNHYFLGSVAAWIQRRVGGLAAAAPGWAEIDVAPVLDPRVTWAHVRHETVRGTAEVRWSRTGGHWRLRLQVPNGARASVRVPGAAVRVLGEGAHDVEVHAEG